MKTGKKWYQSVSNWLIILACIILIPILIVNLSIMFQAKTNEDKVPSIFGYKPFLVLSGSMENEIHKGDLIITKIIDPEMVKVDDVIAFRDAENTVTTHRIIEVVENNGENYFITKGDNNSSQDKNLVSLDDIEGIYIGRIPGLGSMMNSLAEPTTIIILLLGITIVFVIGFAISSKKQREIERKEFLEFKRMKEEMTQATSNKTKKMKSIKAVEDDYFDNELLEEDEEVRYYPQRKKVSTNNKKITGTVRNANIHKNRNVTNPERSNQNTAPRRNNNGYYRQEKNNNQTRRSNESYNKTNHNYPRKNTGTVRYSNTNTSKKNTKSK